MRHVGIIEEKGEIAYGLLWVDEAGKRLESCPFLRCEAGKYFCSIQDIKPEVCTYHFCEKYY